MTIKTSIKLLKNDYDNMLKESYQDPKNANCKHLESQALNTHLKREVFNIEKLRNDELNDIQLQQQQGFS